MPGSFRHRTINSHDIACAQCGCSCIWSEFQQQTTASSHVKHSVNIGETDVKGRHYGKIYDIGTYRNK